jgi:type 1 glutamine amidotransferase
MTKALVVRGGWTGHEPVQTTDLFIPFLRAQGFEVVVSETLDSYVDAALMASLTLVVPCWTMGEMSQAQSAGLLGAIKNGVNIAGWHGGMGDSFRQNTEYQFMVGGQWVAHPGGIVEYEVNIIDHDHPITNGIPDFKMTSEQYYMHVDPSNEVQAVCTFTGEFGDSPWIAGCVMPAVWTRTYGKGRVFYTSLGHVAKDFEVPEARAIVQRGLLWAAGELGCCCCSCSCAD